MLFLWVGLRPLFSLLPACGRELGVCYCVLYVCAILRHAVLAKTLVIQLVLPFLTFLVTPTIDYKQANSETPYRINTSSVVGRKCVGFSALLSSSCCFFVFYIYF